MTGTNSISIHITLVFFFLLDVVVAMCGLSIVV